MFVMLDMFLKLFVKFWSGRPLLIPLRMFNRCCLLIYGLDNILFLVSPNLCSWYHGCKHVALFTYANSALCLWFFLGGVSSWYFSYKRNSPWSSCWWPLKNYFYLLLVCRHMIILLDISIRKNSCKGSMPLLNHKLYILRNPTKWEWWAHEIEQADTCEWPKFNDLWFLSPDHKRDAARAEDALTLSYGSELIGMQRDWNEELQACREFPHTNPHERYINIVKWLAIMHTNFLHYIFFCFTTIFLSCTYLVAGFCVIELSTRWLLTSWMQQLVVLWESLADAFPQ